jgi:hypothetical protein
MWQFGLKIVCLGLRALPHYQNAAAREKRPNHAMQRTAPRSDA